VENLGDLAAYSIQFYLNSERLQKVINVN